MEKKTKIVVVGAGFGGIYAFKTLHRIFHAHPSVEFTLLSKESTFLFTPLLHEVATGGISPENVVEPLRKIFRCCSDRIIVAEAEKLLCKRNEILTEKGAIPFDYCILAPGAETNFCNIKGAQQHSFVLKTLDDAQRLKNHCIRLCERAAHAADPKEREALLHVVVIGGGPTGVELAAELAEYMFDTIPRYYRHASFLKDIRITLLHRGKELIPHFSSSLRRHALHILMKKNISVKLNACVKSIKADYIELGDGEKLLTRTPIWVAGVSPVQMPCDIQLPYDTQSRLSVNDFLQMHGSENIFVIGDAAACKDRVGCPIPGLAQVAVRQGVFVVKNIQRILKGKNLLAFSYRSSGNLLSLGQGKAIADIKGVRFSGPFAWWLWRTIYLSKLISWDHKVKVAVDWTIGLFSPRDISDI